MSNPRVIKLDIKIDSEKVFRGLEQLRRNLDQRDAMLDEIGQVLAASTRQRFKTSTAPDGTPWKELSPKPLQRKKNKKILVESTELVGSIHHEAQGDTVTIGTNAEYAAAHQFGATIRPKAKKALRFNMGGKWFTKKSVTIPARPFLGLSKEDEEAIKRIVLKHLGAPTWHRLPRLQRRRFSAVRRMAG